jgi:hypothetical protein
MAKQTMTDTNHEKFFEFSQPSVGSVAVATDRTPPSAKQRPAGPAGPTKKSSRTVQELLRFGMTRSYCHLPFQMSLGAVSASMASRVAPVLELVIGQFGRSDGSYTAFVAGRAISSCILVRLAAAGF